MNWRLLFPLVIGLGGIALLVSLGTWQVQRLGWKEALLADIETRIAADPVPLPVQPDPDADRYLPVRVEGRFVPDVQAKMLASRRQIGAVHRHIVPFETLTDGRILVDIGWTEDDTALAPLPTVPVMLTGNLDWPRETDGFTPAPDLKDNFWFARDVPAMAQAYDTRPILLVLRAAPNTVLGTTPWPVDTAGIPNDHLQYAITWFSLAAIWGAMTFLFVWRSRNKKD
ncbi:SURF1 family protein [Aliishimia ponticola]|uniref:SURF1-like protein n=1 Tax=Aliishimia ponticola TaxID=2499833 RepID=A0A4S4NCS4_9RHOB|nr:SURF1 family protein [Aliishimia ponticola]THH37254.1 SURF1 family protein [Aliishimia ponticola]